MGSGRREVFPTNWGHDHGKTLANTLDSRVRVHAATGGTAVFDTDAGYTTVTGPAPLYTGPASVMPAQVPPGGDAPMGEELVPRRYYEIAFDHDVTWVLPNMVITVDHCPNEPMLTGQALTVDQVERGTRRFTRHVIATLADQGPDAPVVGL